MAYFDNAATTFPKPECVYEAMDQFYRASGGSVGRGNYGIAKSAKKLIEETRGLLKDLLHCPSRQVIFEPTATIALNVIIQGLLQDGAKQIYISPFEHNAVTRVLHHFQSLGMIHVHQLTVSQELNYDLERIRYQFEETRPDLVIVSHASNVIGLIAPAEDIFKLAKKYGATTVLDMSQTAGLVDCNLGQDIYDYAVFAGHKTLLGPTGISGFFMKSESSLPPILFGGTGYDSANQDMPSTLPERFECGTMNISGIAGLNASTKWIIETGTQKLFSEEKKNRQRLLDLLGQYDFLSIIGNEPHQNYVGIVSCILSDISSDTAGQLFSERNIAVRTGLHCAPLAHKFLGTFPSGTIRLSVNHFTTDEDFTELQTALDDLEESL